MVQQQFFAKDLSFPVNKGRVLMGTSGNISKSFRVVSVLEEGSGYGEVRKWAFHLQQLVFGRENIPTTGGGRKGHIQKKLKETSSETGIFL